MWNLCSEHAAFQHPRGSVFGGVNLVGNHQPDGHCPLLLITDSRSQTPPNKCTVLIVRTPNNSAQPQGPLGLFLIYY